MKKIIKLILVLLLSVSMVGCSEKKLRVGYTVYPIQYLIETIGTDFVEPVSISDGKIAMRSNIRKDYNDVMQSIDTLFTMGALEPYLDVYLEELNEYSARIKDLSAKSGIFEFARFERVDLNNDKKIYNKSEYYDNPKFNSIDVYVKDPNLWLDPITMTSMAKQIRDYLISTDPDRTNFYKENYTELEFKLAHLDASYLELRNSKTPIKLATMSPSFGIWQKNYDIGIYPVILSKYGVLPTIDQLELIKQRLIADDVKYIVDEPGLPDDVKDLCYEIAEELDLTVIELSSLSYITEEQIKSQADYMEIMLENLKVLEELE